MTIEERIKRCLSRHVEWEDVRTAKSVGCRVADVRRVREATDSVPFIPDKAKAKASPEPISETAPGLISLATVREKYDVASAIEKAVLGIPKGKLISDSEMCARVCGSDRARYRRCLDNFAARLNPFRIKLKLDDGEPKYYWGRRSDIQEASRLREL